jgi:uncharacterized membrane protein
VSAAAPRRSGSSRGLVIVLGVLGVLAIILAILYIAGAANSIHVLVGSVHKGHHIVRAVISFVVGLVLLGVALFTARSK